MMKFTYPIGLGLTALAGLPAAMSSQSLAGSTEEALARTLAALEEMEFISLAVQRKDPGSIQRVLDATEAAILPPAKQDQFLTQLRKEVGELQVQVSAQAAARGQSPKPATTPANEGPSGTSRRRVASSGETPATLEPLGEQKEAAGFNADSLRQGRLLFRDSRFTEAIKVLSAIEDNPEAEYWVARSYEAVGNDEEAVLRYQQLTVDPQDEGVARRAAHDLGFLQWKQRFYGAKAK